MTRSAFSSACAALLVMGLVGVASSQTASTAGRAPAGDAAAEAAEREKIWNSPTMLRARAWVQEYCQRSAKITPEEAKQYMTELEHLSPVQMKLWLLKFDHEEAAIRQQQADFEKMRRAGIAQATSINSSVQQSFGAINRDETEAAEGEQASLDTQQGLAAQRDLQNDQSRDQDDAALGGPLWGAYGGYGYPYMGLGPNPMAAFGGGETHIHYHVHQ